MRDDGAIQSPAVNFSIFISLLTTKHFSSRGLDFGLSFEVHGGVCEFSSGFLSCKCCSCVMPFPFGLAKALKCTVLSSPCYTDGNDGSNLIQMSKNGLSVSMASLFSGSTPQCSLAARVRVCARCVRVCASHVHTPRCVPSGYYRECRGLNLCTGSRGVEFMLHQQVSFRPGTKITKKRSSATAPSRRAFCLAVVCMHTTCLLWRTLVLPGPWLKMKAQAQLCSCWAG